MSADRIQGRLTVLGCRAGSPGQGSAASGYLLTIGKRTLLIDCGPGVVLELTRRILPATIDAVIITHRHADHCADLVALAYHQLFPQKQAPLPLFGPPDLQPLLQGLSHLFRIDSLPDLADPLAAAFAFQPLAPGTGVHWEGIHLETMPAHHPVPTLALRFPDIGLVYSSDGAYTPELVDFATGARLLTAEATYVTPDGHDLRGHGHMTARQAGELAHAAGVQRLMLTHFADCDAAEISMQHAGSVFGGPVLVAVPGLQTALS